jgi:hypothetical protein
MGMAGAMRVSTKAEHIACCHLTTAGSASCYRSRRKTGMQLGGNCGGIESSLPPTTGRGMRKNRPRHALHV